MPILDMPIEELKSYRGISPLPDDFDDYWDRALAGLPEQGGSYEWKDAEFKSPVAECGHLFFKGKGGSRIHAKTLIPRNIDGPVPAVIHFHGYTSSSAPWTEYLPFAASGIAVFAMDCRGQGGLSEDLWKGAGPTLYGNIVRGLNGGSEELHYRSVFLDTVRLAGIVMSMENIDENKIGVYGVSQGGALSIACAALEPRISCLAPLYPFLSDYRRVWDMDLDERAYVGLRDYFRNFDPLHLREDEVFNKLGYIDISNLAGRIRGKVLFGATLMDDICPPSTQFAAYNRMECEKEMLVYKDFGHERIPDFIDQTYSFLVSALGNNR